MNNSSLYPLEVRRYDRSLVPYDHATFDNHVLQAAVITQPTRSDPTETVTCPVCERVLLPHEVADHPHNTTRTTAHYIRANDPHNLSSLNRYHVFIPDTNEVIATITYDPHSDMWRVHYSTPTQNYSHMVNSLNDALISIELDSLQTGQNLLINNWK